MEKMKNWEIKNMYDQLSKLNLKGVKIAYAVSRNMSILKPFYEAMMKSDEMSEEYLKYNKERLVIAKKWADKDASGKAIMVQGLYQFNEHGEEYNKELDALKEKHKEAYEKREVQTKEMATLFDKEEEVALYKIKIEEVPADITTGQMNAIYPFIISE